MAPHRLADDGAEAPMPMTPAKPVAERPHVLQRGSGTRPAEPDVLRTGDEERVRDQGRAPRFQILVGARQRRAWPAAQYLPDDQQQRGGWTSGRHDARSCHRQCRQAGLCARKEAGLLWPSAALLRAGTKLSGAPPRASALSRGMFIRVSPQTWGRLAAGWRPSGAAQNRGPLDRQRTSGRPCGRRDRTPCRRRRSPCRARARPGMSGGRQGQRTLPASPPQVLAIFTLSTSAFHIRAGPRNFAPADVPP